MFYINILNQLPHNRRNFEVLESTTEAQQKSLTRYHQAKLRKVHQRVRENHRLERRYLFRHSQVVPALMALLRDFRW